MNSIIKPKDYWLVPATVTSLFLLYTNFWFVGLILFVMTCVIILRGYGALRTLLHVLLSIAICFPLIMIISLLTNY